jgi:hypothetical protein
MAANPLPRPQRDADTPPVKIVNVATCTDVDVVPEQPIEWENSSPNDIDIVVTASGVYPLAENTFKVKGTNGPINTKINGVLLNCPLNSYPFSRNGVAGAGKIVVSGNVPDRR